ALRRGQMEAGRSLGVTLAASSSAPAPTVAPQGSFSASRSVIVDGRLLNSPKTAAKRLDDYMQNARFVAGKNFFQHGEQWVDAEAQKLQGAKRVQLKFGSPEYFEFYAKNATARPWLAVGRQVQFVHNGTLYEVVD